MFRNISDEYPDIFFPPTPEPKQRLSVELIQLATAVVSAVVVLSGLPHDHPWLFKAALAICGMLLAWYALKWAWRGIQWMQRRSDDARFVSEEQARLQDIVESF